jgi:hypothetical protein
VGSISTGAISFFMGLEDPFKVIQSIAWKTPDHPSMQLFKQPYFSPFTSPAFDIYNPVYLE